MNAEQRRSQVLACLQTAQTPLSASHLAAQMGVSRQIIVGDIALLRACGHQIFATPRGYLLQRAPQGLRKTVACVHTREQMEQELNLLVDNGCTVLDVIVEHPVYGQLTGSLQLHNRYDVKQFIERAKVRRRCPNSQRGFTCIRSSAPTRPHLNGFRLLCA